MLTLGSLFDGIGGWLLAAEHAGVKPIWSSEIEKLPIAVTAHHFPKVKQMGDINGIDGGAIPPADIVTMGSPCQDLSIAGTRKGLKGERSGLFHEANRVIREMRQATKGVYPRYVVWENVTGAYSSNRGMDFKTVLESLAKTDIPMPGSGKWAGAGMVRSKQCSIIWRTLDAQYWGVAQRRRRIFLVVDYTGGGGTEEILFKPESLQRPSRPRQTLSATFEQNVTDGTATPVFDISHRNSKVVRENSVCPTITRYAGTGGNNVPVIIQPIVGTLLARDSKGPDRSFLENGKLICEKDDRNLYVRRLTPLECERLQGLPDDWTNVTVNGKQASDSARYRAIGNGMAQPCADFVIARIKEHNDKVNM